jgi:hypothetical protein
MLNNLTNFFNNAFLQKIAGVRPDYAFDKANPDLDAQPETDPETEV